MLSNELLSLTYNEHHLSHLEYVKLRDSASEEDLHKLEALAERWEKADAVEREFLADEVADIALGIYK